MLRLTASHSFLTEALASQEQFDTSLRALMHTFSSTASIKASDYAKTSLAVDAQAWKQAVATFAARMPTAVFGGVPANFRCRAIFFDMDSTVIREESIVALAECVSPELRTLVNTITERAMAGELNFASALRQRVSYLRGLAVERVNEVALRLTLSPGIQAFAAFCREVGVPMFLVSGGFAPLAGHIARRVGFQGYMANRLAVESGALTGEVEGDIVDAEAKRKYVVDVCTKLQLNPSEVAAVGDGANDLLMFDSVGVAVGFRPKASLLGRVHAYDGVGDHRFLAPLLFGRSVRAVRREDR